MDGRRLTRLKILYVIHQFLPRYFTGTEQYAASVALEAQRRGHEVQVFTLEPEADEGAGVKVWDDEVEGLAVRRVAMDPLSMPNPVAAEYDNPLLTRLLRRAIDEFQPDVVHVFHLRGIGAGGIWEARAAGVRTVVHLMDFWFFCPDFLLLRPDGELCDGPREGGLGCLDCINADLAGSLAVSEAHEAVRTAREAAGRSVRHEERLGALYLAATGREEFCMQALAAADAIVAPSGFMRETFEAQGVPADRLTQIPYGMDPDRLASLESAVKGKKKGSELVIGYVGSLVEHKGVHLLIEAFRRTRPGAVLRLHGRTDDYPQYVEDLLHLVDGDSRITFEGSFSRDQLGEVLSSIDLLVVPSIWYENNPLVMMEARAAGVPVAASRLGGLVEQVEVGTSGFLFDPTGYEELQTLLDGLVEDPSPLRAMNGPWPVRTLAQAFDAIEDLYESSAA